MPSMSNRGSNFGVPRQPDAQAAGLISHYDDSGDPTPEEEEEKQPRKWSDVWSLPGSTPSGSAAASRRGSTSEPGDHTHINDTRPHTPGVAVGAGQAQQKLPAHHNLPYHSNIYGDKLYRTEKGLKHGGAYAPLSAGSHVAYGVNGEHYFYYDPEIPGDYTAAANAAATKFLQGQNYPGQTGSLPPPSGAAPAPAPSGMVQVDYRQLLKNYTFGLSAQSNVPLTMAAKQSYQQALARSFELAS